MFIGYQYIVYDFFLPYADKIFVVWYSVINGAELRHLDRLNS
jgi:hypothetical protein